MLLARLPHRTTLALAAGGVLLLAGLLWLAHWVLVGVPSQTPRSLHPQALAPLEGVYRDAKLTLRLRYAEPYLWARTGESRWERLAPTGLTTLRGTVLGYEIDITRALRPDADGLPRVTVSAGSQQRELVQVLLPVVAGVPTTAYLRGSMNDWGTATALESRGGALYVAELSLAAGKHEFKVGSADWFTIDLGGNGDPAPIAPGQTLPLYPVGSNIHLTLNQAGSYRFELDLRNPRRPTVTVTPVR